MPWFKIEVKHGPGRQSTTRLLRWWTRPTLELIDDYERQLKEQYDDWEYGPSVISFTRLRGLKPRDHQRLLARWQENLDIAQSMLNIVKKTRVLKADPPMQRCPRCKGTGKMKVNIDGRLQLVRCRECEGKRRVKRRYETYD